MKKHGLVAAAFAVVVSALAFDGSEKPNVVVILTDDQGWDDNRSLSNLVLLYISRQS
jgi:hypothetical protein